MSENLSYISENKYEKLSKEIKKQQRRLLIERILSNKLIISGTILLIVVLSTIVIGTIITPYSAYEMNAVDRLQGPSASHLFGTDNFGRDVFTRVAYGGLSSLQVAILVCLITGLLGLVVGVYSGYFKILDHILMRISDGMMAFPSILLAIALMAALGPNLRNLVIALTIVYTPLVARVVRSSALVIKEQTYIEAVKSQGATSTRIIWSHIIPNSLSPLIIQASFIFAEVIIIEAGLSFLGVGIPAPTPSWGNILFDGKIVIMTAWWMILFPGIGIICSVLGLNLLGDGLRDILDPQDI